MEEEQEQTSREGVRRKMKRECPNRCLLPLQTLHFEREREKKKTLRRIKKSKEAQLSWLIRISERKEQKKK